MNLCLTRTIIQNCHFESWHHLPKDYMALFPKKRGLEIKSLLCHSLAVCLWVMPSALLRLRCEVNSCFVTVTYNTTQNGCHSANSSFESKDNMASQWGDTHKPGLETLTWLQADKGRAQPCHRTQHQQGMWAAAFLELVSYAAVTPTSSSSTKTLQSS